MKKFISNALFLLFARICIIVVVIWVIGWVVDFGNILTELGIPMAPEQMTEDDLLSFFNQ